MNYGSNKFYQTLTKGLLFLSIFSGACAYHRRHAETEINGTIAIMHKAGDYLLTPSGEKIKPPAYYLIKCAPCHHDDGCGRGPVVFDYLTEEFKTDIKPATLGCPGLNQDSLQALTITLRKGIQGKMPAFPEITDQQIEEIYYFMKSLATIHTGAGTHNHDEPPYKQ